MADGKKTRPDPCLHHGEAERGCRLCLFGARMGKITAEMPVNGSLRCERERDWFRKVGVRNGDLRGRRLLTQMEGVGKKGK